MRKGILSFLLAAAFTPLIAHAEIHPVASVGLGIDYIHLHPVNENFTLQAPFQDTYLSGSQTLHGAVGDIFLGIEAPFYRNLSGQIGVSYFRPQAMTAKGTILQFGDPDFNNKGYQQKIQTQQVFLEMKLLSIIRTYYPLHPYILAAVGESFNKSYDYAETPLAPYVIVNQTAFANHSSRSFVYAVGLGIDMDLTSHLRVGLSYRQTELGSTSLGLMPGQTGTNVLSYSPMQTNEILLNVTYVG